MVYTVISLIMLGAMQSWGMVVSDSCYILMGDVDTFYAFIEIEQVYAIYFDVA